MICQKSPNLLYICFTNTCSNTWVIKKKPDNLLVRVFCVCITKMLSGGRETMHCLVKNLYMSAHCYYLSHCEWFILIPVIQINIRRCHSDGCDTRIRGIKAVGYRWTIYLLLHAILCLIVSEKDQECLPGFGLFFLTRSHYLSFTICKFMLRYSWVMPIHCRLQLTVYLGDFLFFKQFDSTRLFLWPQNVVWRLDDTMK